MPFIPHTEEDTRDMLNAIGVSTIEDLFSEIPAHLQVKELSHISEGLNEMQVSQLMRELAEKDNYKQCFIGAGAYSHYIPAAVWELVGRGEFLTAYTPYQPEVSQGTLQGIYEYQTKITNLLVMDVSNASVYDGASGIAEACLMAGRIKHKHTRPKILIPTTVHPYYRQVVKTIVSQQDFILETLPYDRATGCIQFEELNSFEQQEVTALIIQQPNFFGNLEDVDALTAWAHERGILVIAAVNPIAMALLKPPGQWADHGADIACGEGQPLGIPLASGGPYFGFLTTKKDYIRQMPGRLVGQTVDSVGSIGYTLTLQAREQHIRRAKATSNICTNQGLAVTAATIHMSLLGAAGLRKTALLCVENLNYLKSLLEPIKEIEVLFKAYRFHELVIKLPIRVDILLRAMADKGIEAGFNLTNYYPELGQAMLICVTETKTKNDLETYVNTLRLCLKELKNKESMMRAGDTA